MKSQRKRTREKKQRQANMSSDTMVSGSLDDTFIIGNGDITIDLGDYSQNTYTIPSIDTITLGPNNAYSSTIDNYTISTSGAAYSWSTPSSHSVEINTDGVAIKEDADLKIGDRSLKDFMDKVEDHLAILKPAPELEEKWEKLRELRRQYDECKQDILEKEKIMKILKED